MPPKSAPYTQKRQFAEIPRCAGSRPCWRGRRPWNKWKTLWQWVCSRPSMSNKFTLHAFNRILHISPCLDSSTLCSVHLRCHPPQISPRSPALACLFNWPFNNCTQRCPPRIASSSCRACGEHLAFHQLRLSILRLCADPHPHLNTIAPPYSYSPPSPRCPFLTLSSSGVSALDHSKSCPSPHLLLAQALLHLLLVFLATDL
ncbi:hypothetical protein K438DRAFT_1885323 [Mycena galopus ATCC 62051]|nr:hypothetical protein K438DRAFT_1885323 [Mycena galopus ATCC 62051]